MLKYETVTRYMVGCNELERFIKEKTGKDFSIISDQLASNDSVLTMTVEDRKPDSYTMDALSKWMNGHYENGEDYILEQLMIQFAKKHYIPFGEYLVTICC